MTELSPHTRRWLFWLTVIALLLLFTYAIRSVLLPFVLGIGTAYLLDPAADRLQKLKLSRGISTAIITLGFFIGIILLGVLIIPVIIDQFSDLLSALPGYITEFEARYGEKLSRWLGELPGRHMQSIRGAMTDASGMVLGLSGGFLSGLFQSGMAIVNLLSLILITPVVTFYLLRDWDLLTARFDNLLPRASADTIRNQLAIIDATLAGFIRGQLTVCLILGCIYALGLSIAGLKFGIVVGLATGMLAIIPYVGLMFGMTVAVTLAFFQFETIGEIGAVLAVFAVGQILEGYFLTPKLVGERVGLHPVWVIFGMLAGATLFGFVGVLLAVPITAVIGVLIRFAIQQYLISDYYKGQAPAKKP